MTRASCHEYFTGVTPLPVAEVTLAYLQAISTPMTGRILKLRKTDLALARLTAPEHVYFPAGAVHDAFVHIRSLFKGAMKEIFIIDRYVELPVRWGHLFSRYVLPLRTAHQLRAAHRGRQRSTRKASVARRYSSPMLQSDHRQRQLQKDAENRIRLRAKEPQLSSMPEEQPSYCRAGDKNRLGNLPAK